MAEFSPQEKLFNTVNRLSTLSQSIFWAILAFSVAPIVLKEICEKYHLLNAINILNIIGISLFFALEIITEFILTPLADRRRRDDFIDNSFGSKFSTNSSKGYYDNDEVNAGLYKAAVNQFENCFFTNSLVQNISSKRIIIPVVGFMFITVFGYYGFKEVPFALSVLQTIFSANILGLLIKHLILLNRLSAILDSWITLFQNNDLKTNTYNYQAYIYRYWLQYECLHSKIAANIPRKIYINLNPFLTDEWLRLKAKYAIS